MDHNDEKEIIKVPLNLEKEKEEKTKKSKESNLNYNTDNKSHLNSKTMAQSSDKSLNSSKNEKNDSDDINLTKSNLPISSLPKKVSLSSQTNFPKHTITPNSRQYDQPLSTSLVIIKNNFKDQKGDDLSGHNDHHKENESLFENDNSSIDPTSSQKSNQENHQKSDKKNGYENSNNHSTNDDRNDDINIELGEIEKADTKSEYLNPPFQKVRDLDKGKEFYRLSGMNPLKTVCYFSIGPLVNQISLALESFIETIWVSKVIGKDGMSAVSSYSPFESITQAFGLTASFAGSCAISAMIATNKTDKKEANQVIVDLLRVCIIVGVVLPAVLCPLVEKSVRWFGTSEKIAKLGFKYILPVLICTFSTCMFLAVTGFIEGEGRPILFSLITVLVSVSNVAILCPLFLLGFKIGIVGAGIAKVLSRAIPLIILLIFYFKGAFTFKPKINQFIKNFSPLTMGALKACLSQGFANLIAVIPSILIRKILGKMTNDDDEYDYVVSSFQAVNKYSQLFDRIVVGFAAGYLAVASFAYNKNDFKRWLFLTLHVNWICFAWCTFTVILTFSIPKKLAEAFLSDNKYLIYAGPMIRNSNCFGFFAFVQYTVGHMLRSIKMGFMAAVIGTLIHVSGVCVFAIILYNTNKKNIERLMYSYPLANLLGLLGGGAFIAYPCYKFYKEWKFNEENISN